MTVRELITRLEAIKLPDAVVLFDAGMSGLQSLEKDDPEVVQPIVIEPNEPIAVLLGGLRANGPVGSWDPEKAIREARFGTER